jgi:hypothetical protein
MTRALFERVCRIVALAALAIALWLSVRAARPSPAGARRVVVSLPDSVVADSGGDTGAAGVRALRPWVQRPTRDSALFVFGAVPAAPMRAALGAMHAAGVPVHWMDSTHAVGLAVSASRSAVPGAPLIVRASAKVETANVETANVETANVGTANADIANADRATGLVLRDAGGVLDSMPRAARALSWQLASATPPLMVQQGTSTARLDLPDSVGAKRVLVVAQPGWEGKFVVAALEESGWQVDGTMRVSPSGAVTVGAPQRLSLERYAAVVVLDSMAVDASTLQAFVNRGGGVVLGGDALRVPALASLRPARTTALRGAIAGALLTDAPRGGLDAWELDVAPGAVVLQADQSDHGHSEPALVARRNGRGRVVAMPYRETWRWRMQGSDNGAADHRRWWQSALSAAAAADTDGGAGAPMERDALPGRAAP